MMPGSVCRHLKIARRLIISRLFHVTSQQPRKLQHIRLPGLPAALRVLLGLAAISCVRRTAGSSTSGLEYSRIFVVAGGKLCQTTAPLSPSLRSGARCSFTAIAFKITTEGRGKEKKCWNAALASSFEQ